MPILIYDGECNLCSKFLRFIVGINKNPDLKITNLKSKWTQKNIELNPDIDSMFFIINKKRYIYSDAVIHLLATTHYIFKPLLLIKVIPKPIRDGVYRFVAKRRKNIFKNQSCPLLSKKAKQMFLP